jgi:hypothetical protein
MKYGIISYIGLIISIIIILLSLFGPWYSISLSAIGRQGNVDMSLTHIKSNIVGQEQIVTYEDFKDATTIIGVNADELDIFAHIRSIVITSLLFAIIGLIIILLIHFISIQQELIRISGLIFCILVFILGFIACIYLMAGVFHEGESFWFNQIILGVEVTGRPGYAWYLMFTASVIALTSSIPLIKKNT